jgi:hypothetical protein
MSMTGPHSTRSGAAWRAACAAAALAGQASVAMAAPPPTVAYLRDDADGAKVQIERQGRIVPYDPDQGFLPCDDVMLKPGSAAPAGPEVIAITIAHEFVPLGNTRWRVGCDRTGVQGQALAFIKAATSAVATRVVRGAYSRDLSCPRGEDAEPLDIPILPDGARTLLAARDGRVYLTWTRGYPPFRIELRRRAGGATVFRGEHLARAEFTSPAVALTRGGYVLELEDRCGRIVRDEHVEAVAAGERPPLPPELAGLPEPQRTLFYADQLVATDRGRWSLEAMQLVAALPDRTPAVAAWLRQWGD